jgi:hypothetical protein
MRKEKSPAPRALSLLSILLLGACALVEQANRAPVLGSLNDGVYTHAKQAFSCPLPTSEQSFTGAISITDAGKVEKTVQRVIPVNERRPWDPVLRDEVVSISYTPSGVVLFEDAEADKTRLEIGFRTMKREEDPATVLTSGYGGGNYGLLLETERSEAGRVYGVAVAQLPYWPKESGPGYAGVDLWASFLNGDEPAPTLDVIFNLIEGDRHFWFLLRNSALEFVPAHVNPKDLDAVYEMFKADQSAVSVMENRLWVLVKDCQFSDR